MDTLGWDQILVPATISKVRIKNVGPEDLHMRSDATDASTDDLIPVGGTEDFVPYRQGAWRIGDTLCFLQAATGVTTAVLTWST